jgi:hypothetical protein
VERRAPSEASGEHNKTDARAADFGLRSAGGETEPIFIKGFCRLRRFIGAEYRF